MGVDTPKVKYLLYFFNFLFVIGGAVLVLIGALSYTGYKQYENLVDLAAYQGTSLAMMIFGVFVVLTALLGCFGIVKESKYMMMTYATFLTITLIAEVAIAIAICTHEDDFKEVVHDGLKESIGKYANQSVIAKSWDMMQENLKCCGIDSYKDWKTYNIDPVPLSCCVDENNCKVQLSSYFAQGCLDKALAEVKAGAGMYVAIFVALIEVLGIIFGVCLGARFGRESYPTEN